MSVPPQEVKAAAATTTRQFRQTLKPAPPPATSTTTAGPDAPLAPLFSLPQELLYTIASYCAGPSYKRDTRMSIFHPPGSDRKMLQSTYSATFKEGQEIMERVMKEVRPRRT